MRERGVPQQVVHAVARPDADRLAARVEASEMARAHLAEHGLVGVEPPWYATLRRIAKRLGA